MGRCVPLLALLLLAQAGAASPATGLRRDFSTAWVDPDVEATPALAKVPGSRRVNDYRGS